MIVFDVVVDYYYDLFDLVSITHILSLLLYVILYFLYRYRITRGKSLEVVCYLGYMVAFLIVSTALVRFLS